MLMEYKLTIVMSNYNQANFLRKALQSVFEQKVNYKYKIIITDDCSTKDDSIKFINELCKKHKNIEAIYSKNNTRYLANILRGLRRTSTEYFCLLDADDFYVDNKFLQKAFDFLEKNLDYSIYESNVYVLHENEINTDYHKLNTLLSPSYKSGTYTKDMFVSGYEIPITQTTGMFFRDTIFKKGIPYIMETAVGTISERSFEGDVDRFIMHLKTGKAYYCSDIVGVYSQMGGIWCSLPLSEKYLLTARAYLDYYGFYESDLDFFQGIAWKYLRLFFSEKENEVFNMSASQPLISKDSAEKINSIFQFCYMKDKKTLGDFKMTIRQRIKRAIRALLG